VQHAQRVKEPFAVAQLIAHAVQRDDFILQIQGIQLIPDRFPVFLNFAEIPGRDAEDQYVVLFISAGESSFRLCSVTSSGPMISRIFSAAISV
jgi:hypothetical protein